MEKIKVASLFCGCGGMDLGALGGFSFLNKEYETLSTEIVYAVDNDLNAIKIYNDRVILLIPRIFFEANMTSWFKANVNAGYRLVGKVNAHYVNPMGEEIPIFKSSGYSKPEFSISLLFGNFGIYRGLLSR